MGGEVIKSFLVGLGFGVDDASLSKFNKAIANASLRVTALYASIKVAAAGIFWGISKISEGFEQMGYEYRIIAPAINKALMLRQALLSAYRAAGINITKVVQESVKFNFSLAKTKFALEAVYKSVGAKFLPLLTKQMDVFRSKIYANMPRIQDALTRFVNFIFKAFDATVILGTRVWSILERVYDFFRDLDQSTDGWSTRILGAIAAWKLLNLSFLATPLGMIITGLVGILALFDDFKTWQEGGESLFDWTPFLPVIAAVKDALGDVKNVLGNISMVVFGVIDAFIKLITLDFSGFKNVMVNMFSDISDAISNLISGFFSLIKVGGSLVDWATDVFGKSHAATTNNAVNSPSPLLPQSAGVNQKVSQETHILVQGSADASATGKAVAGEQSKVNFDLTRNLKGATR